MSYPLSVSMTPSFYDAEHMLLRAQLKCLAQQTVKDFDVWLVDPHYSKRKTVVPELAQRFGLDIKHVPYWPCTRVAKLLDCAVFNAAFCYSQSPMCARFSCYRFVRPCFVETVLSAPEGVNVDFFFHAVGPDLLGDTDKHKAVWDFGSENVNWAAVPTETGYDSQGRVVPERSLARWYSDSDQDTPVITVPDNLYGNIAWLRKQWLAVNGTNEVVTNTVHWEDIDFDVRAGLAGQKVVRRAHVMYRLYHQYGAFSQRSNVEVDVPCRKPCERCEWMRHDFILRLPVRLRLCEVDVYEPWGIWLCRTCQLSGPVEPYTERIRQLSLQQAPILVDARIGRNLRRLAEDMDKQTTLKGKVDVFNGSWDSPRYYET